MSYLFVYFLFVLFTGFKATMNYDKCLEERNATLSAWLEKHPVNPTAITNGISSVTLTSLTSSTTSPPLPECDLEKELDSVCRHFDSYNN